MCTVSSVNSGILIYTWKSPKDDANEYSNVIEVNWISEYSALGGVVSRH